MDFFTNQCHFQATLRSSYGSNSFNPDIQLLGNRSLTYTQYILNVKDIFTPSTLDTAYLWLCKQRANFSANADIWHLSFHWHSVRQALLQTLNKQDYTFMPLSVITKADGENIHLWSSQYALAPKMLAMT